MFRHHRRGRRGPWFGPEEGNERRARRGDVKFMLLEAIAERPMHGYDVMQYLEQRNEGRYRPSPGSVYPTLQMLEDGGFLTSETVDGKRVYSITGTGRELLKERNADAAAEDDTGDAGQGGEWREMRHSARRLYEALRGGFERNDPATWQRIRKVVDDARREIYQILADEE